MRILGAFLSGVILTAGAFYYVNAVDKRLSRIEKVLDYMIEGLGSQKQSYSPSNFSPVSSGRMTGCYDLSSAYKLKF